MAACYLEEEEVWKCPKHPSKRRRHGVCSACLRDRLLTLCPDCASLRPCACAASSTTSSSSSSSSSSVGLVSNLITSGEQPSFRRSRSVAIPFLRAENGGSAKTSSSSFLSILKRSKTRRTEPPATTEKSAYVGVNGENFDSHSRIQDFARMVTRSRSVSGGAAAAAMAGGVAAASPGKGKFWHFSSPMKAFRSSRTSKAVVQNRSPLHRG